jgi:hypothetical protein
MGEDVKGRLRIDVGMYLQRTRTNYLELEVEIWLPKIGKIGARFLADIDMECTGFSFLHEI